MQVRSIAVDGQNPLRKWAAIAQVFIEFRPTPEGNQKGTDMCFCLDSI